MEKDRPEYFWKKSLFTRIFYGIKPLIPRSIQISLRRKMIRRTLPDLKDIWPIDPESAKPPEGWNGWPDGKRFALVLTHDVESTKGLGRCRQLAEIEMKAGFRSSFNFLLQKYSTPDDLRRYLEDRGFEVGIHGCHHDGKKFTSRRIFLERAEVINRYIREWGISGFRAPSMHCNLDWIGELDIAYDLSTFDTDPFEPQGTGVRTIYPFTVSRKESLPDYVELPYTLPQDFTLFVLMKETTDNIWRLKLDWIAQKGGMALVNVHPDYINFGKGKTDLEEFPLEYYEQFLHYVKETYEDQYYHALPRELAKHVIDNSVPVACTPDETTQTTKPGVN